MIPAAFDYHRASSVDEAIALLTEHGDEAKLLAGGHSLLPMMKLRLAVPSVLVDVGPVGDLSYINDGGDHIAIGALTRHRALETSDLLDAEVPLLSHVASLVGDPQVRHRGTIGGSIAHSDPASDLPAAVLALGGTMVARGPDGEREIAAHNNSLGQFELVGIPAAPRGATQVEVTFDIDSNGIVSVQARDLTTQREQKILVTPASGLTETEIEEIISDAK